MATTTLMSFADFERLEQGADKIELLKGELIRVPPPTKLHNHVSKRLFLGLHAALESLHEPGRTLPFGGAEMEMGYRMSTDPPSWLQPDVSVTHPEQPSDASYYVGAPLLAFEVVSQYDKAPDLNDKIATYLANGAAEVWLIYPKQRHAWVYDRSRTAHQETQFVRSPLLPGIEIPLSEIL